MSGGFGSHPQLYTLGAEGKGVRCSHEFPEGPDFPWYGEYLREEWARRHHLQAKRTALPFTVAADQAWEQQERSEAAVAELRSLYRQQAGRWDIWQRTETTK